MINLFNQRKPRGFHHQYMYVDERDDKLKAIEQRAKQQLGQGGEPSFQPERLRGTFINATKYARRRRERRQFGTFFINTGMAVMIIIFLLVVWKMLLS